MKLTVLAQRNAQALQRMVEAAKKIAPIAGVDKVDLGGLNITNRDPQVEALLQREAVASLLEAILAGMQKQQRKIKALQKEAKEAKETEVA